MLLILLTIFLKVLVDATPNVSLPLNSQTPPVARVNQPYLFVFADSTFTSSQPILSYTISNAPGWISLDGGTRTFSGTPSATDVGPCVFNLVAADVSGSIAMSVTFIVSVSEGPGLGLPVADQLSVQNGFSSPNSLLIPHSTPLSLVFSPDTFTNTNVNTVYYAMCANHTPLPSWIYFSPSNLSFYGMTPLATSVTELPVTFEIEMTASEVPGFAGAITTFSVTVELHLFTFSNKLHVINVTDAANVSYAGLQHDLYLDGHPANASSIAQINSDAPSGLDLDGQSLLISGSVPNGSVGRTFTVNATDIYGETASTSVMLVNASSPQKPPSSFLGPLGTVIVRGGSNFQYDFHSALNGSNAVVNVTLGAAASWLTFEPSSLKLHGTVPTSNTNLQFPVSVTASMDGRQEDGRLVLSVLPSCTTSDPSATCAASATPSTLFVPTPQALRAHQDRRWIALAVVLPTLVTALVCAALFGFYRRRRQQREEWETDSAASVKRSPIRVIRNTGAFPEKLAEMSGALGGRRSRASSRQSWAPMLDVPGLWRSATGNGSSKKRTSRPGSGAEYSIQRRDSWQSYARKLSMRPRSAAIPENEPIEEEGALHQSKNILKASRQTPDFPRFSVSSNSSPSQKNSQSRKTRSHNSFGSSALLSSPLNGFGHGRSFRNQSNRGASFGTRGIGHGDGFVPPRYSTVRDSLRNFRILKALTSGDGSSHGSELYTQCTPPRTLAGSAGIDKNSIRVISEPSQHIALRAHQNQPSDAARPSTAQRTDQLHKLQEFHRKRVQLKNTDRALFTAGPSSSRVSSYGSPPQTFTQSPEKPDLSPLRPHRPKELALLHVARPKQGIHRHKNTLSEIFDSPDLEQERYSRARSISPARSSDNHSQSYHVDTISSEDHNPLPLRPWLPTRPATARSASKRNSAVTDDLDSRWESASSDAASMDPYIYSRGDRFRRVDETPPALPLPSLPGTPIRAEKATESNDVQDTRAANEHRVPSSMVAHADDSSTYPKGKTAQADTTPQDPSWPSKPASPKRTAASRFGVERLAQQMKRFSRGRKRAESRKGARAAPAVGADEEQRREDSSESSDSDDDDRDASSHDGSYDGRIAAAEKVPADAGPSGAAAGQALRVSEGPGPGRVTGLGERRAGIEQGEPGNMSFKGVIRVVRPEDDEEDSGEGKRRGKGGNDGEERRDGRGGGAFV